MYVGAPTFDKMAAFLEGYDQATRRLGQPSPLTGWTEWLIARRGLDEDSLHWRAQVLHLALPKGWTWQSLSTEQDQHALKALFELLDEFLAEHEATTATANP